MHFDYKVRRIAPGEFSFYLQNDVEAFSMIFRQEAPASIFIFEFKFCYEDTVRIKDDILKLFPNSHSTPAFGDPDRRSYWNLTEADRVMVELLAER